MGSLPEVQRAFERVTGWSLRYLPQPSPQRPTDLRWSTPVNPGHGVPPGLLRLSPVGHRSSAGQQPPQETRELASALAGMLGELVDARHALWLREAELAAGVPLVPHKNEKEHLAAKLQAVLKAGAEAVDCQAAGLYLLDEATTSLKLRSCWGLPLEHLAAAARPLDTALADLEAMLGHAVVLEDAPLQRHWNPPEDFAAAVCVPVSTATTILGTLWFFSPGRRGFSDRQTNLMEVIAGRAAADLEREILLREGIDGAGLKRQAAAIERMQRNGLPTIAPLLDGWDVAGWTAQAQAVGGDFHDWFGLPDGLVAVAVGDVLDRGMEAAFAAAAVKAALRSHGQHLRDAAALLQGVNMTLWTGSAGDQFGAMFCGLIETATGRVRYAAAGRPSVVRIRPGGWQSLTHLAPLLGESPESEFQQRSCRLEPGEALAVFSDGVRDAEDATGRALGEKGLAETLLRQLALPASRLVAAARDRLHQHAPDSPSDDRTILVVKRAVA